MVTERFDRLLSGVFLIGLLSCPYGRVWANPTVTPVYLDSQVFPQTVSPNGTVAGTFSAGDQGRHLFTWTPGGGLVDLGSLAGFGPAPIVHALAVSDAGEVFGVAWDSYGSGEHVFTATVGGVVDWGAVGLGFGGGQNFNGRVDFVNDRGQFVGVSQQSSDSPQKAFLWTHDGGYTDLGTLGGATTPKCLGSTGIVVGSSVRSDGEEHAFSWTASSGIKDLGSPAGYSFAYAVSPNGTILVQTGAGLFLIPPGGVMIPVPLDSAVAVNDMGQVAGDKGPDSAYRAYRWSPSAGAMELTPGGTWHATSMNAAGNVVARGYYPGGDVTVVAWTDQDGLIDLRLPAGTYGDPIGLSDSGLVFGYEVTVPRKTDGYPLIAQRAVAWQLPAHSASGRAGCSASAASGDLSPIILVVLAFVMTATRRRARATV